MNETLAIDGNDKGIVGFVTDDANQFIRRARIDDATKGLKVMIVGGVGAGTVTSVSVVTANGFAGSVATSTTTPAITLSTTLGSGNLALSNGTGFVAAPLTGTGNVVLATSPTFSGAIITTSSVNGVTLTTGGGTVNFLRADGTYAAPPAGTVTSVSGTTNRITVATGTTTPVIDISATFEALLGKVASPLSQFASTTSAQLAGVISDETGTGVAVFNAKPTFVGTVNTIVAVAALALDGSLGSIFTKTIASPSTFTQSNFSTGQCFMLKITGAFTPTFWSGITWITSGATAPTQGAITTYGFVCTGSNTFDAYLVGSQ